MKLKKVTAFALAAVMTITCFAGCGKTQNDSGSSNGSDEVAKESDEKQENVKVSMFLQDSADQAISPISCQR